MNLLADVLVVCVVIFWLAYTRGKARRSQIPLPPGPKRLPFIGNALDLPVYEAWEAGLQWKEKYGTRLLLLRHSLFIHSHFAQVTSSISRHSIKNFCLSIRLKLP